MPFRQDVDFFLKRGAKELDRNDLLSAIQLYRKAYDSDPTDLDSCLALAELLSQMQRFEESNRLLLIDMSMNDPDPESYFGLACNYYGMQEFAYAHESLETYLQLEPDGYYAYDAADFLDLLEDEAELADAIGMDENETLETLSICRQAKWAADCGNLEHATALLETHLAQFPAALRAKNQLAIVQYCMGNAERAAQLADEILAADPKNVQARCSRILFLHVTGDTELAAQELEELPKLQTEDPEALASVSLLQLEMGQYAEARQTLSKLWNELPYDENVVHRMGYCRYMLGDIEGACDCYRRLLRINPDDTVAQYYLTACRKYDPKTHLKHWLLPYRVPFVEMFRRFQQINAFFDKPHREQAELWREDRKTRNLLSWALTIPEQRSKVAIIRLIATMQDANAERVLRDFLLRTDQPDSIKREALAALKRMQAREPFMVFLEGRWVQGSVNVFELPAKLPAAYEGMLRHLAEHLLPDCTEARLAATAMLIHAYIGSFNGHFPRISANQQLSLAAALELLGRRSAGEKPDEAEIAHKYRVSLLRLHNAVKKVESCLEEPPCD